MSAQYFLEVALNLPLQQSFTYASEQAVQPGCRVQVPFRGRKLQGIVIATSQTAPQGYSVKDVIKVLDEEPLLNQRLLELATWMAGMYFASNGECLAAMVPNAKQERPSPALGGSEPAAAPKEIQLSPAQAAAVSRIKENSCGRYYVYGVTGSGKTEVFLQAAEYMLSQGKDSIYLVPEIALTHQVVQMIQSRFGHTAAVLHSRLTASQRLAEWRRIRSGKARMVVGARSAVFAPVQKLGLIILDEEHESAYKSSEKPRYHARQLAMKRCSSEQAALIMGSATPSVEAKYLMEKGQLEFLHLPERVSGGNMPELLLVDMRKEKEVLSRKLREEMDATLQAGRQIILFLNRRGFSHFFHCHSCGAEMQCPHCSVGLTLHKERGRLVCHYCGYSTAPVDVCPQCGSLDVGYAGFGTEHIQDEVARHFPFASCSRLDTDVARKKGAAEKILQDFKDQKTDILLGTQMVAKGLNFPALQLVGVILADTGLHLPDFRAAERTFTLLTQVAGRAGRYTNDGKVIIQTYHPGNPTIRMAVQNETEAFYQNEIDVRKLTGFPPFSRMIRVVLRGKNKGEVQSTINKLHAQLPPATDLPGDCLGPAECPLGKIAGNFRYQLLFRASLGPAAGSMHQLLKQILSSFSVPKGIFVEVDVDPVHLL